VTLPVVLSAESVEYEAYNQEIAGYGNAIHGQRRPFFGNAQPDEHIQQSYLQEEIKKMGTGKTDAILFVRFLLKGEMGRQQVVEAEADDVADGIGNALVYVGQQYQVDGVVDGYGYHSDHSEAEKFPESILTE
jgi:hypothetical protein